MTVIMKAFVAIVLSLCLSAAPVVVVMNTAQVHDALQAATLNPILPVEAVRRFVRKFRLFRRVELGISVSISGSCGRC